MNLFLVGLSKTEMGVKTAPRVLKLGHYDGRVPKLSSRVTLPTPHRWPVWSVLCVPFIPNLSWPWSLLGYSLP